MDIYLWWTRYHYIYHWKESKTLIPAACAHTFVFRMEFWEYRPGLVQTTEGFKMSNAEHVWKASESFLINYTTAQHQP